MRDFLETPSTRKLRPADAAKKTEATPWLDPVSTIALFSLVIAVMTFCYLCIQQDDAYIFYTYARNLSEGHGYTFNRGERFNGTTSALYTLALALSKRLFGWIPGMSLPLLGHLLGAVCLWIAAWIGMKGFARQRSPVAAGLFPFLLLLNPYLRNAVGMETFLTVSLLLLAAYYYQEGRWQAAAGWCALSVLSRPDSVLMAAVLAAHYGMTRRRLPPIGSLVIFGLVLLPWYVFSWIYFGELLPSTVVTKIGQTQSGLWGHGWVFLHGILRQMPRADRFSLPLAVVSLAALVILAINRFCELRAGTFGIVLLSWNSLYVFSYVFINPPDYPWYYTPFAVGMAALMALSIEAAWRMGWLKGFHRRISPFIAASMLSVLACALPIQSYREERPDTLLRYRDAAAWLNANAGTASSVGADEVGILGYFYRRGAVVDGLGLVTPGVASHVRQRDFDWYVQFYQPNYLVFHRPAWLGFEDMTGEPWFQQRYRPAAIVPNPSGDLNLFARRTNRRTAAREEAAVFHDR